MTGWELVSLIGAAASILTVISAPIAFLRWFRKQLEPIHRELSPNGGNSVKDVTGAMHSEVVEFKKESDRRFNAIESHLDRQDRRIDGLYSQGGTK